MTFDESDWRSKRGNLGSLNLFRTCSAPSISRSNLAAVEDLKRSPAKYGKTLPQFALRWTLSNPVVGTALVGFRNASRGEGESRRPRLGDQRRRYGRGRRHPRPSRRGDRAAGLARGLAGHNQFADHTLSLEGGSACRFNASRR